MVTLSKRLEAIASMITAGNILADVGTDHAYIPIYQIQCDKNPRAIAMDLRKGPLERAAEHILQYGLSDRIETRLSNGVEALEPKEADTIVIAGMGGELIMRIISDGEAVCKCAKELILQPQSEIAALRRYLRENGYRIAAEDMVFEDGKYYSMMRVSFCGESEESREEEYTIEDLYGPFLLEERHPVLKQYLQYQEGQLREILRTLHSQPDSEKIRTRIREIETKAEYNRKAQNRMAKGR